MARGLNLPVANSPVIRKVESGVTGITKCSSAYQILTTIWEHHMVEHHIWDGYSKTINYATDSGTYLEEKTDYALA